ncbi:hypothetical protein NDU88_007749 [Pleurodeles waltl]|uniref:Uncharacterized protein n=1 Tax=Pleurodeles waltl TaxID=8319 RepID=A0AAV7U109_PLEWA|nr:hypothetical protein NDU88_007749 [Pleurodeles waltl]
MYGASLVVAPCPVRLWALMAQAEKAPLRAQRAPLTRPVPPQRSGRLYMSTEGRFHGGLDVIPSLFGFSVPRSCRLLETSPSLLGVFVQGHNCLPRLKRAQRESFAHKCAKGPLSPKCPFQEGPLLAEFSAPSRRGKRRLRATFFTLETRGECF